MQYSTVCVERTPSIADVLRVTAFGLPVIPLKPHTKKPAIEHWQTQATTDPDQLRSWWQRTPDANIGHVIPRGRLVVDVDPRHNGLVHWKNLLAQHGDLPATWKVWSGRQDGGFHLYFTVPDSIDVPCVTDIAPGVQILGFRHNVLLPPSIHPHSKQPYAWDAQRSPDHGCPETPAPLWLLDVIQEHTPKRRKTQTQSNTKAPSPSSVKQGTPPPLGTLFPPTQVSSSLSPGAGLVTLACDPSSLPDMLAACGLDPTLQVGQNTHCPLHDDAHPSATLLGPTDEHRSYGLFCHAAACQNYYSLTNIYHFCTSGNLLSLHTEIDATGRQRDHAALRLQWTTRLLEAAGVLHIQELGAPTLPSTAPDAARDLWCLFLHVRRIRSQTRKADSPMPFSWRFIEDWAGKFTDWTARSISAAKRWLISHGYLELAFKDGLDHYWRVGSHALRRARRGDAPIPSTEKAVVAEIAATVVPEPVQPTSACPDAHELTHNPRTCELCRAQARILEVRRQRGITIDYANPYGRGKGMICLSP